MGWWGYTQDFLSFCSSDVQTSLATLDMKESTTKYIWPIAVAVGIVVGYGIGFISVYVFREYGWTIFSVVPFFLGMIPAIIFGSKKKLAEQNLRKLGLQR